MNENLNYDKDKQKNIFEPLRKSKSIHEINAREKNKRRYFMIVGASFGLILCLTALVIFKKEMSEEITGIIYTIAGIFGACLTEAYNFEFGFFKKKFRNKNKLKKNPEKN